MQPAHEDGATRQDHKQTYVMQPHHQPAVVMVIMSRLWDGLTRCDSGQGQAICLFSEISRPALWPTQRNIQEATDCRAVGALVQQSPQSPQWTAEVKNQWSRTSVKPMKLNKLVFRNEINSICFESASPQTSLILNVN